MAFGSSLTPMICPESTGSSAKALHIISCSGELAQCPLSHAILAVVSKSHACCIPVAVKVTFSHLHLRLKSMPPVQDQLRREKVTWASHFPFS